MELYSNIMHLMLFQTAFENQRSRTFGREPATERGRERRAMNMRWRVLIDTAHSYAGSPVPVWCTTNHYHASRSVVLLLLLSA